MTQSDARGSRSEVSTEGRAAIGDALFELNGISVKMSLVRKTAEKFGLARMDLFGSLVTDELGPESDVDVLVFPLPGVELGPLELDAIALELGEPIGRRVDVATEAVLLNPFRRRHILSHRVTVYGA